MLLTAECAGLTLNLDKCSIGVDKIQFLGDVIDKEDTRPSPSLIKCMLQIPAPTDKQAVQSAWRRELFQQVYAVISAEDNAAQKFIKQNDVFEWMSNHAQEWKQLCDSLSKEPLLSVFNPRKATKVYCDASQNGIGASLLQDQDSR